MSQYYSRSVGVGTLTIYDADMAITTIYSMAPACVGSTLVRKSHSITQKWREECTGGLFSLPVFLLVLALCGALASEAWRHSVDDHNAIK